jgi:hypothetical protein
MTEMTNWHIVGDWFDNCSCAVACPCTFAQAPDNGFYESVLFWNIREGHYGDIKLDGLSFVVNSDGVSSSHCSVARPGMRGRGWGKRSDRRH